MKRRHEMPFGAELLEHGVHFRLWAPAAQFVELGLGSSDDETFLPMPCLGDGWFELLVADAGAGSRYRFRIDRQLIAPDPASRFNPDDVHRPSEVIDPAAYAWGDRGWRGRSWEEAVIYELHIGCFTAQGTFAALERRLDYLLALGVTAIELMPVAAFPGRCNWGYDGVLPFAPDCSYGRPEQFKSLIDSAHRKGLMVLLDVVYNHFGPEGNYLHHIAPQFFTGRHHTPWGGAIDFAGPASRTVRDFFIHNALYWLEEFNLDGLRLDAVHAIFDDSSPDFLTQLAQAVRAGPARDRHIHLILENDHNAARYLERDAAGRPRLFTAQWNDDIHHALHLLASGEAHGYYADYADAPVAHLGRCLTQGFSFQGQASRFRAGRPRGEASRHLPPAAFVTFLQNHDQVGNRAHGERLSALIDPAVLRAVIAVVLLAPSPPLLFMGEEFAAAQPFQFFCDFEPALAAAVTLGRRREFADFDRDFNRFCADPDPLPDPGDPATFARCRLDWSATATASHAEWLEFYRTLLALRHALIVPRLKGMGGGNAQFQTVAERGLSANWRLGDGSTLLLLANLGAAPLRGFKQPAGDLVYASNGAAAALADQYLTPWSVAWFLQRGAEDTGYV